MDISEEINKKAKSIVKLLNKGTFFEDYPFILPLKLEVSLQIAMYKKYKESNSIDLSTKELNDIIYELNREGLSETIYQLSEKGFLKMAINPDGELMYTIADSEKPINLLSKRQKLLLQSFYLKK